MADQPGPTQFGANAWVVEELYRDYLADPSSVPESWHDFFSDYDPEGHLEAKAPSGNGAARTATKAPPDAPAKPAAAPAEGQPATPTKPQAAPDDAKVLRGVGAAIAENMVASLTVPTATSLRDVPAKLLEVNRRILNNQLQRTRGGKVSFTHLIGWAVVRAMQLVPAMRRSYLEADGKPHVRVPEDINLGLAIDVERPDGTRTLLVPNVKGAQDLDFAGFLRAYEDIVRRVRTNDLAPELFAGTTATLTNPGTVGTVGSVPRLMKGQSVIVGVGAIDYPAEWKATDPRTLADIGVGKVITITSTYDHRVIQGAESGLFLKAVQDLLLGEHGFYDEIFESLRVPYEPVRWRVDTSSRVSADAHSVAAKTIAVGKLTNAYRVRGHLIANLNPLQHTFRRVHPELDPSTYGLTIWDLDREFPIDPIAGKDRMRLGDLLGVLRDAYCRTVGIEYLHIHEPDQKAWIQSRVEGVKTTLTPAEQRHVLDRLNAAEAFERFLHTKFVGQKRFSLEGSESIIAMLDALLTAATDVGLSEAVLGMAHRGRLNVLSNTLQKSYEKIFKEFEGALDPNSVQGSGDVKYHLGTTGVHTAPSGRTMPITLAANPSHLEAVDPVVVGMARAKGDRLGPPPTQAILPVLLHGDAAFAGQGVVAETLGMSQLKGYQVGGTVHLVINNQLGFTTAPHHSRSSEYATDVAKMVQAPIFHVNGDDPEACVRVARLAFEFRQAFSKDVVIDMVSYRRYGHNESDEPAFTQPIMYAAIDKRRSVRKLYTEELVNRGDLTLQEAEQALEDFRGKLEGILQETKKADQEPAGPPPRRAITGVLPQVETGVALDTLQRIIKVTTSWPADFEPHPKLVKLLERRRHMLEEDAVDWPTAELLALGTLLAEGSPVRLAGQDSRRGTFSQRHSTLIDHQTGGEHIPLQHLGDGAAAFMIYDSPLNEFASLGFEYGYSVVRKDALMLWEAQFGDFVNGAQVVIDQFIAAAEDKWDADLRAGPAAPPRLRGAGPGALLRAHRALPDAVRRGQHPGRQPTTAAQYFHLLRRQLHREVRKPLVIITPKSLLRAREVLSPAAAFTSGHFREILPEADPPVEAGDVQRVFLTTGKVAYDLRARRNATNAPAVVVRVEQLYPWPHEQMVQVLEGYPNATELRWVQDEPENMGAWPFLGARLYNVCGPSATSPSAAPPAWRAPAPPPARQRCTSRSSSCCWTTPSPVSEMTATATGRTQAALDLCSFVDASPSPFHAVAEMARRLDAGGFTRLSERETWALAPGDARYVVREGSLAAFRVGSAPPDAAGFRLVGAHTDSPTFKVRPRPGATKAGYRMVGVEVYGGPLAHTWMDRDLTAAGRVVLHDGSEHLVVLPGAPLKLASLAIHLTDRTANPEGARLNAQEHLQPLWSPGTSAAFLEVVAAAAGVAPEAVLGHDLVLADTQPAGLVGHDSALVSAPRLDNLSSCHAAVSAILAAEPARATQLVVANDHEEVGSGSAEGAKGSFLQDVLRAGRRGHRR